MWEISDDRYDWMKKRIVAAMDFMSKHEKDYPAIAGYMGIVVEQTLRDLEAMTPGNGMTEEDFSRLEEEVEAKR